MKRTVLTILTVLTVLTAGTVQAERKVQIHPKRLEARQNMASDQPGTSGRAFRQFVQKLAQTGYTPLPAHPKQLISRLPSIIAHVQGLLDSKDAQIASKQAEIEAHAAANQFRQAFDDQVVFNNLIRQRCQIQDGYNEIQSWALAMLIRRAAGK